MEQLTASSFRTDGIYCLCQASVAALTKTYERNHIVLTPDVIQHGVVNRYNTKYG